MSARCYLLSNDTGDEAFVGGIASDLGLPFEAFSSLKALEEALDADRPTAVFWNIDLTGPAGGNAPKPKEILLSLRKTLPAHRIFVLSEKPLSEVPELGESLGFGTFWARKFLPPASSLAARFVQASFQSDVPSLSAFFPEDVSTKPVFVTESMQRNALVQAIENTCQKKGVAARLAQQIAIAADELLMNAIFDAPMKQGKRYRSQVSRSEPFALKTEEIVTFEMAFGAGYGAIQVTDPFGSLERQLVQRFIRRDYSHAEYQSERGNRGAGLGVYGIIHTGFSLYYDVAVNRATRAMLFFPAVSSFKDFRRGFQFFGFSIR